MSEGSRAVIFGRDAAAYDRFRPSYPADAVSRIVDLVDATDAVEVGAGTGKATADIAREGLHLTCLEPSTEMASMLIARDLPGVEVVPATLEEWQGEVDSVDLVFAAQSWHWVDRGTAYDKTLSVLRPGGALALMWNIPLDRYGRFEEVYARHAPGLLEERDQRIQRRDNHRWDDDIRAAGFEDIGVFTQTWSTEMSPGDYCSLHATYSDHMMLAPDVRSSLLEDLERAAHDRGGSVTVSYRTEVVSGRAP
jgi:SAM-dependent methyltransferase